jgi:hypothetical protein
MVQSDAIGELMTAELARSMPGFGRRVRCVAHALGCRNLAHRAGIDVVVPAINGGLTAALAPTTYPAIAVVSETTAPRSSYTCVSLPSPTIVRITCWLSSLRRSQMVTAASAYLARSSSRVSSA